MSSSRTAICSNQMKSFSVTQAHWSMVPWSLAPLCNYRFLQFALGPVWSLLRLHMHRLTDGIEPVCVCCWV